MAMIEHIQGQKMARQQESTNDLTLPQVADTNIPRLMDADREELH
jgi:hypothetical protein